MKGALAIAIGLIALQALTGSELPGLAPAIAYPAQLVAKWMDPAQPLITQSSSTSDTSEQTSDANQLGIAQAGVQPPPKHIAHHGGA